MRDMKKMNITFMKDNHPNNSYFYEMIVFTGDKKESGTSSKVNCNFSWSASLNNLNKLFHKKVLYNLHSDMYETGIRVLNEENRESVLKPSSVDTFIMAVKQ